MKPRNLRRETLYKHQRSRKQKKKKKRSQSKVNRCGVVSKNRPKKENIVEPAGSGNEIAGVVVSMMLVGFFSVLSPSTTVQPKLPSFTLQLRTSVIFLF